MANSLSEEIVKSLRIVQPGNTRPNSTAFFTQLYYPYIHFDNYPNCWRAIAIMYSFPAFRSPFNSYTDPNGAEQFIFSEALEFF